MKRIFHWAFCLSKSIRAWLTRRFTSAGLFALLGLAVSAGIGLDTKQTMAFQAFTFLFFLLAFSFLWGLRFRADLQVRRKVPPFASVSEPVSYRVIIENRSGRKQEGLTVSEEMETLLPTLEEFQKARDPERRNPFDRWTGYYRWAQLYRQNRIGISRDQSVPALPARGSIEVRMEILPLQRGYLRLSGLRISRNDPFGMVRSSVAIPGPQSLLVLPRRYPVPPLHLPGTRRHQPGGVALASSVGDSEEFISLRDYRPGDPLRKIHWKSWAKRDKPVVKEYQDEFFVRHALILDTFQEATFSDSFEEAVAVAASFACTVQTQDSLLDLMFVGTEAFCFTSGRGLAGTDKMLEILACVRPCIDKPFSTLPPLVIQRVSLLSGCICVLLSWDQERRKFIALLKALNVPVLVLVIGDKESESDLDPDLMTDHPEEVRFLRPGRIKEGLARL